MNDPGAGGEPLLRNTIEANLHRFERIDSADPRTAAAVAVVLLSVDGDLAVPIFQRTQSMSRHAGQMALPGGKRQVDETAEECAIREAGEELGLDLDPAGVLGRLDDFDTASGFTITPVVLWSGAGEADLRPSPFEVAKLFLISVAELRRAAAEAAAGESPDFSLRFPAVQVFAPTAAILYQFAEVALEGRPSRVRAFYQPPFTHR